MPNMNQTQSQELFTCYSTHEAVTILFYKNRGGEVMFLAEGNTTHKGRRWDHDCLSDSGSTSLRPCCLPKQDCGKEARGGEEFSGMKMMNPVKANED